MTRRCLFPNRGGDVLVALPALHPNRMLPRRPFPNRGGDVLVALAALPPA
jgi:hypothetical protein